MMNVQYRHFSSKRSSVFALIVSLLWSTSSLAQLPLHFESPMKAVYNPLNPTVPTSKVTVSTGTATATVTATAPGTANDISIADKIELGIDVNYQQQLTTAVTCVVTLSIDKYEPSGTYVSTETGRTLTITYDPLSSTPKQDKDIYVFTGYHKIVATITGITVNGGAVSDLPFNMYVTPGIDIQRITPFSGSAINPSGINTYDLNSDGIPDEVEVTWPSTTGVEQYQVEWTYVNNYDGTSTTGEKTASALAYSFKNNSTRITTSSTFTSYRIPVLFDMGYVIFRIRGLGKYTSPPYDYLVGSWGGAAESGLVSSVSSTYYFKVLSTYVHENNKNWQVTTTFAEEGKKKEVASYFDGSLRSRQTVTRINTDDNVIVGETFYDKQGRPAVTVLPTPVEKTSGTKKLQYYPGFNLDGSGGEYNADDFDKDGGSACTLTLSNMTNNNGASKYYSTNNINKTDQQAFVPDAEGYPFTQVEYTPDNTGRIKRQGGVGDDFQLGTGHETKYYYGQPVQEELDRLFASEVGDAAHYKKNMVVDPNGQVSVSYLDQEGRVVATALAGDNPANLSAIPSQTGAALSITTDLFNKDANGVSNSNKMSIAADAIEFNTQLTVSSAGTYTFNYNLDRAAYDEACLAEGICFNCIYDLTVSIKDECGVDITGFPVNVTAGQFTVSDGHLVFNTTCTSDAAYTLAPAAVSLNVGTYTVTKTLKVNEDAVSYYVNKYLDKTVNTCAQNLADFQNQYISAIDFSNCEIDCNDCITALGSRDEYVSSGKGTAMDYDFQMDQCKKMCNKMPTACELAFEQMKADVSPGGQYGDYLSASGTIDPAGFALSVFNATSTNLLPAHQLLSTSGYWRYPKTVLNGVTYNSYVNSDGSIAKINVVYNASATPAYYPLVNNTGLVTYDASTGVYSTPVENLSSVSDFITHWRAEWALGLVTYHPEYIYYTSCAGNANVVDPYPISSDDYDATMMAATTAAAANSGTPGLDFINGSNVPFDPSVVTTGNIYDPWLQTIGSTYRSQFMARYNSYVTISSTTYNIYQFAAIMARCSVPYVTSVTGCSGYGTTATTAVLDAEWNNYKTFYQQLKREFQNKIADANAVATTTYYGENDCIGNADDYNPFTSAGMIDFSALTISAFMASPYFSHYQPCGIYTKDLYAAKVARFPGTQNIPGYSPAMVSGTTAGATTSGETAAYQVYLQTGQCPKAGAVQGIFNAMAVAVKIDYATGSGESLIPYPEFNAYYSVINNYVPTVAIATGANYYWKATVISTNVLQIDWKNSAGTTTYQTFTLTKPGTVSAWSNIVAFSNMVVSSTTAFTITAKLNTGAYVTITGTTNLDMYNCNFPEVCHPNEYALDIQELMGALAFNGNLTSATQYHLNPSYKSLETTTIKAVQQSPVNGLTWKYNSTTKVFTLQDSAATTQRVEFTIIDPASVSFTSVKYYGNVQSEGTNIFTLVGYDNTGAVVHTLRLSAVWYSSTGTPTPLAMGDCDLPLPLACQEDPYQVANQFKKLLNERLVWAAAQSTYPTLISLPGSTFMTPLLLDYFPGLFPTSAVGYTSDHTGPSYNETVIIDAANGCNIVLTTNTTQNVHFDDLVAITDLIAYGPTDIDGNYTQFKLVATFPGPLTDTIYGTGCLPLKNCEPCGEFGSGPTPVFANTSLECSTLYTQYHNAVVAFNAVAAGLGLSTITEPSSGYFNYNGYCNCAESYIGLLQGIMSGAVSATGTNYNDIGTYCSSAIHTPCVPAGNNMADTLSFPSITVTASDTTACELELIQQALANAEEAYNEYVQDMTTQIANAYRAHCLGALENFTAAYTDKEYHFTLYYYDQAGNLIKTVPPAGVEMLTLSSIYSGSTTIGTAIKQDRTNGTRRVFTGHRLATAYEYNSLNQLVKQNMPDHDQMDIWSPALTYGLDTNVTVTKVQFFNGNKGFLTGFLPSGRGVLYTSNDAGVTWKMVQDVVGTTINKVQMVTTSTGYAVGNQGVILKTTNGGSTWDMLNTYAANIPEDVIDLAFESDVKGVVILKSDSPIIVSVTSGGSTLTRFTMASLGVYNRLSAITYNATAGKYIVTSTYKSSSTVPEVGAIYSAAAASVTTGLWTANTTINSYVLNKVSYNTTTGTYYLGGDAGNLHQMNLATPLYTDIAANVTGKITDVYFGTANDGVAIIENTPGQGMIYRTSDAGKNWTLLSAPGDYYTNLSFYEKVIDGSGDLYKLTAVGTSVNTPAPTSIVKKVIMQVNNPGGIVDMNGPASGVQLNTSWSFTYGGKTQVMAGGNSGKLYFTGNAGVSAPLWAEQTSSGIPTSENVLKITGFVDGSGNVAVYVLTKTNIGSTYKLYKMYRAATPYTLSFGTAASITLPGSAVPTNLSASDVSSSVHLVYFYNHNDRQLYKVSASIDAAANTAVALTNAIPAYTGTLTSLATTLGTDLMVTGTNGLTYKGLLNSATAPASVTWTDYTNTLSPLPFTDVQQAPTASGLGYAVTGNGDVFENYTGTSWRKIPTNSSDAINAMGFDNTATSGMTAQNGKLCTFTITPGVSVTMTALSSMFTTANYKDVAINGTVAAAVADNGLILVNENYPTDAFVPALNQSAVPLYGLSVKPSSTEIVAVGSNAQIRKIAGNTSMKVTQVFPPNLNSVHFYNELEGYVVGDNLTARHTSDGGQTWQVVLPTTGWTYTSTTLPKLRGVFTNGSGLATLVGTQGKVYFASGNVLTVTATSLPTTVTLNDVETSGTITYAVGTNGTNKGLVWYNGSTWTSMTLPLAAGVLNGIHTFARNNSFIVVGSDNTTGTLPVIYYGRATSGVLNTVHPSGTMNLYDVNFIDDVNGYVVGNTGTILKSLNFAYSPSGTMDYTTFTFNTGSSAGPLSGQTTTSLMDIRTVYAIDHTHLITGGVYNGAKCYARLITDESQRYSTKFWYDRLGRIAISQNTRQYNAATKLYSYTVYDALGRVVEAGEKTENTTSTNKFSNIFGAWVNHYWNPNVIDDAKLSAWVTDATGARGQVTRSYYDKVETSIGAGLPGSFVQDNLRKRISAVAYYPTYSGTTTAYDHATHYTYDIHGNVKSLLQDNKKLAVGSGYGTNVSSEQFNRVDYDYDLISGNVNEVSYEAGKADQWYHQYDYDADNRITDVKTSDNNQSWDQDATYFYYNHGPLARVEYGQNLVQGMDYAYTLHGWIKGTNSNDLNNYRDMGRDSYIPSSGSNNNQLFAADVAGYTLNYFNDDYKPIDQTNRWSTVTDRFEASKASSNIDMATSGNSLYNGNIRAMVSTIMDMSNHVMPQATLYGYDQLNRLITTKAWANLNTGTNVWGNTTYAGLYQNDFTYDANGNILTQVRKNDAGTTIDNLTYNYYNSSGKILKNRLYHVDDAVTSGTFTDDIDDMGTFNNGAGTYNTSNNYIYDAEGRLTQDLQEQISSILWRVDGKVAEVQRTGGSTRKNLKFDYDAMGQRIAKHQFDPTGVTWEKSTYYVRDAQGNVMATYEKVNPGTASLKVKERDIYGSSRVGMYTKQVEMIGAGTPSSSSFQHETGSRQYELSNHLGNVLAVITDRKRPLDLGDYDFSGDGINDSNTPQSGTADNRVDFYRAELIASTDYSPFGVDLNGRSFSSSSYRYGFQGQEKDNEIKPGTGTSDGNSVNFTHRMYDTRLGRFLSLDHLSAKYPSNSPYAFSQNRVIDSRELEGNEAVYYLRFVDSKTQKETKIKVTDYTKEDKSRFLTITGTMKVELNGSKVTTTIEEINNIEPTEYTLSEIVEPFQFDNAVKIQIGEDQGWPGLIIWGKSSRDWIKWRKGRGKGSVDMKELDEIFEIFKPKSEGEESKGARKSFDRAKEKMDEELEENDLPIETDEDKDQGVGTNGTGNGKVPSSEEKRKDKTPQDDSTDYILHFNDPNKGRQTEYKRLSDSTHRGRTIDKKTYDKDTKND